LPLCAKFAEVSDNLHILPCADDQLSLRITKDLALILPYAFHRNWIGMFEAIPRYYSHARSWREPDGIVMGITGWSSATFNAAIVQDGAMLSIERLDSISDVFIRAGVNYTIQLADASSSPDIADLLHGEGYGEVLCDPMMRFEGPLPAMPLNPKLLIQRVFSQHDIDIYYQIVAEGFDLPPVIEDFVAVMLKMEECRHVIAWLDGSPVGAGTLVESAGVAGIYNVATIPDARGQGVATAVMHALHNYALMDGYSGTALASSVMGLPLYHKLGYQDDGYQVVYAPTE
jgi:GNAT superfamily N-acetyltransferase